MKEAYCSYEIAKLLKKKGFDEECTHYYSYEDDELIEYTNGVYSRNSKDCHRCTSPTHQMACAWLRDVHNIDICVFPYQIDYIGYSYEVKIYKNKEMYFSITDSKTYEEAVEIALKYTLNII